MPRALTHALSTRAPRLLAASLIAALPLAALRAQKGGIGIPPRDAGVLLAESPLAEALLDGMSARLHGREIDVVLVAGAKATAGDCLGVEVRAGKFQLRFGDSTFEIGPDRVDLELAIDRIDLSAIKIKTKSPLSACQWTNAFEVGGAATDIKLHILFAPRVRLDDCLLVSLGGVQAHVSIGGLNLKPLQNDIDNLIKGLIEDSMNAALALLLPDFLAEGLNSSILEDLCQTKLAIYKAYMAAMFGQVELYSFPAELVAKLAPLYPTVDLASVRFGYRWQPQRNNTTDCSRIYFSDRDTVERLRHGLELSGDEWNLVFHELQHTEQCARIGSRDDYAKRWFRDLEYAVLMTNLSDPLSYVWELHDNMPLEGDATERSGEVVVVQGTVRDDASGAGVPDLVVSAHESGQGTAPGDSVVASARTSEATRSDRAVGRYYFFVEPGAYDLYISLLSRGLPFGRRQLAASAVQVAAWDLMKIVDLRLDSNGRPLPQEQAPATFRRADSNASGDLNIADVLFTLGWLFGSGSPPACEKAADANDDGRVDVSDALFTLGFLFLGASDPPAPFSTCGVDPTEDTLPCSSGSACP